MIPHGRSTIPLALLTAMILALAAAAAATAAERPVKELVETHIGGEVDRTTKANVCVVSSGDECGTGSLGKEAGAFEYPLGVASGAAANRLYVADRSNDRIQVFTLQGVFVGEFGAGQLAEPMSVAVDQASGDVYVLDWAHHRVVKYTSSGEFLLMVGGEVNETEDNTPGATEAQKNLCTAEEVKNLGVKCKAGVEGAAGTKPHGAFRSPRDRGDLLAVGPGGVLYVGDEGRVQEFEADGEYREGLPVAGIVEALAVDSAGDIYLIDESEPAATIRKLTAAGTEVKDGHWPLVATFKESGGFVLGLLGLAVDPSGRVATTGFEEFRTPPSTELHLRTFGLLLDGTSAEQITEFKGPFRSTGLAFGTSEVATSGGFELYVAAENEQQVLAYRPVPVGELVLKPPVCVPGPERETDATFDCTLNGEVNPWGVPGTETWFEWGRTTALGSKTPAQSLCTTSCPSAPSTVSAVLEGIRPHETSLNDQLAGYDENVQPPEAALRSSEVPFSTPSVPPKVVGAPASSFVHPTSAVLFSELNPENTNSEYFIEYGAGETLTECPNGVRNEPCEGVQTTPAQESASYGAVGATFEATGLQPATLYHYRLAAVNENGEAAALFSEDEGAFTTAPAPIPQATTGAYGALGATSATISGTVDPQDLSATYAFELGVYDGASTQYGLVFSGALPAATTPVTESLQLVGLQPGTAYAYRIVAKNGYGESLGAPMTFTTVGLPAVLPPPLALQLLQTPAIAFPAESKATPRARACKRGYKRDGRGKCGKSKTKKPRLKHTKKGKKK